MNTLEVALLALIGLLFWIGLLLTDLVKEIKTGFHFNYFQIYNMDKGISVSEHKEKEDE